MTQVFVNIFSKHLLPFKNTPYAVLCIQQLLLILYVLCSNYL